MAVNTLQACEKKIKKNQKNFLSLIAQVNKEKKLFKQCFMAQQAASFTLGHVTNVFASEILEKPFIQLAQKIHVPLSGQYLPATVLHVLTEAYTTGGHTRCAERWIQLCPENKHSVVLLNQNELFPPLLKKLAEKSGGEVRFFPTQDTVVSRAIALRQYASRFEYIVLHIHMDDPTALIAFGTNEFVRPIVLFNHADHAFWLGISIADHVADLSEPRHQLTINKRKAKASSVLGIPLELKSPVQVNKLEAKKRLKLPSDEQIIFVSGSNSKFFPVSFPSFGDIIKGILTQNPNILFYIAGVNPKDSFWPEIVRQYPRNVHFTGFLDYETQYPFYLASADLIIDSYPVGGGTAVRDAIQANIPVISLNDKTQADYLRHSKACCSSYQELIEKALHILSDPAFALEILQDTRQKLEEEASCDRWHQKCRQLLLKLPAKHQVHSFKIKLPDEKITDSLILFSRWVSPQKNSLKEKFRRWRKGLIFFRWKPQEKFLRILGKWIYVNSDKFINKNDYQFLDR